MLYDNNARDVYLLLSYIYIYTRKRPTRAPTFTETPPKTIYYYSITIGAHEFSEPNKNNVNAYRSSLLMLRGIGIARQCTYTTLMKIYMVLCVIEYMYIIIMAMKL